MPQCQVPYFIYMVLNFQNFLYRFYARVLLPLISNAHFVLVRDLQTFNISKAGLLSRVLRNIFIMSVTTIHKVQIKTKIYLYIHIQIYFATKLLNDRALMALISGNFQLMVPVPLTRSNVCGT